MKLKIPITVFLILLVINMSIVFAWEISAPQIEKTYQNATISWTTDVPTTFVFNYGPDITEKNMRLTDNSPSTQHSVFLDNLQPTKTYYFTINASNASVSKTRDGSFTTNSLPALTITDVATGARSVTSLEITWKTNREANSKIEYGITDYNSVKTDDKFVLTHRLTLSGLQDKTQYNSKITSCDSGGNCVSYEYSFVSGIFGPPKLEVNFPNMANSNSINVRVKSDPYNKISVFVDGFIKNQVIMPESGERDVEIRLDTKKDVNHVVVKAENDGGYSTEKSKDIIIDTKAPDVKINIETHTKTGKIRFNGSTDERVNITVYTKLIKSYDTEAPPKVTNLVASYANNKVTLNWDKSSAKDIAYYFVFRDDAGLIAKTTATNYVDDAVKVGRYKYKIIPQDTACNIGVYSDEATVNVLGNGKGNITKVFYEKCDEERKVFSAWNSGRFEGQFPVPEGESKVKITASDEAGNSVYFEGISKYDAGPPRFLWTNLAELSPAYSGEVTVRGKVSKPSTIIVVVNQGNKTKIVQTGLQDIIKNWNNLFDTSNTYKVETDENGTFDVDILLSKEVDFTYGVNPLTGKTEIYNQYEVNATYKINDTFTNFVQIFAVDKAGFMYETNGYIEYALCGGGTDWQLIVKQQSFKINPKLVIQGMAQIGVEFNLTWSGFGPEGTINTVTVRKMSRLSRDEAARTQLDWITGLLTRLAHTRKRGYTLITLKHDPGGNKTQLEKEINISKTNEGECFTPVEGGKGVEKLGCVKLPLEVEINYAKLDPYNIGQSVADTEIKCLYIEVLIDRRVPFDNILPDKLLNNSINALNTTMNLFYDVLCGGHSEKDIALCNKGIKVISYATTITCMAHTIVNFIQRLVTNTQCFGIDLNKCKCEEQNGEEVCSYGNTKSNCVINTNSNGNTNNNDDCKKAKQCLGCVKALKTTLTFARSRNWVCDRVFCPSAPTFNKYVESFANINIQPKIVWDSIWRAPYDEYKYYLGKTAIGNTNVSNCQNFGYNYYDGSNQFDKEKEWGEYLDYHSIFPMEFTDKKYCEEEYMSMYRSVGLFLDEYRISKCLWQKQQGGQQQEQEQKNNNGEAKKSQQSCGDVAGLFRTTKNKLCRGLMPGNGISYTYYKSFGRWYMSDSNNKAVSVMSETITPTQLQEKTKGSIGYNNGGDLVISGTETQLTVLALVFKDKPVTFKDSFKDYKDYKTTYCNQLLNFFNKYHDDVYYTGTGGAMGQGDKLMEKPVNFWEDKDRQDYLSNFKQPTLQPNQVLPSTDAKNYIPQDAARRACGELTEEIYAVDPTSGLLTAFRSGCLTAIQGYLEHWVAILSVIKTCLEHIRDTGDGSAGVCRQVYSQYICDALYYLITCVVGNPGQGYGMDLQGETGFFKQMSTAISSMRDSMRGRYGSTSMYDVMFVKRRLIHSACLGFFTGDFDFDFEGIISEAIDSTPIETTVSVPMPKRIWEGIYDPIRGATSHIYEIGVLIVAGMNTNYRIYLKCSTDASCSDFKDSLCDCARGTTGELKRIVKEGYLGRNQILNEEIMHPVASSEPGYYPWYRYDKVVVEYTQYDYQKRANTTKSIEVPLLHWGQPYPENCEFTPGIGFHCTFDIGEHGIAFFSPEPTNYPYVLEVDKPLAFSYGIVTKSKDPSRPNTFWIESRIWNHRNGLLFAKRKNLVGDGEHAAYPSLQELGKDATKEGIFTDKGLLTRDAFRITGGMSGTTTCTINKNQIGIELRTVQGSGAISVYYDGSSYNYLNAIQNSQGGYNFPAGEDPINKPCKTSGDSRRIICEGITFNKPSSPKQGITEINCNSQVTIQNDYGCQAGQEVKFFAEFTLYYESDNPAVSQVGQIVNYNGQEMRKRIEIPVICPPEVPTTT